MRIGIRPINDFAFKKIFGTTANKLALISFLNAVLRLRIPIVDVTIVNPYNLQDFLDDKLSILDIKAIDANGAIYDIEMHEGILRLALSNVEDLQKLDLAALQKLTSTLQDRTRNRA